MLKRVVTGVVLMAAAFAMTVYQGWVLRIAVFLMMLIAVHEVFGAFAHRGIKPVRWGGYVFCLAALAIEGFLRPASLAGDQELMLAVLLCAMGALISVVLRGQPDFEAVAASVVPIVYPGMFFYYFMRIQDMGSHALVMLALIMTFLVSAMNDTFALFTGKALGKHKLIPGISPNKTVEGSIGGLIASVAFSMAIPYAFMKIYPIYFGEVGFELAPMWTYAVFGLVAGVISQTGDLMASLLKRWCGIKDYGKIFPGHGGMMDRLDAILFSAVACYVFFMLTGR